MKPAIFNTDMVRAILDDRKTNTRRYAKEIKAIANKQISQSATCDTPAFLFAQKGETILVNEILNSDHWGYKHGFRYRCQDADKKYDGFYVKDGEVSLIAPYTKGDIIYVRETFTTYSDITMEKEIGVLYKADNHTALIPCEFNRAFEYATDGKWKPSIHMPKEYARLFLRIKDVRIERLNEISEEEARAEGVDFILGFDATSGQDKPFYRNYKYPKDKWHIHPYLSSAKESFKTLWEHIYGDNSFNDDYVWVTEFEKIAKEEEMK